MVNLNEPTPGVTEGPLWAQMNNENIRTLGNLLTQVFVALEINEDGDFITVNPDGDATNHGPLGKGDPGPPGPGPTDANVAPLIAAPETGTAIDTKTADLMGSSGSALAAKTSSEIVRLTGGTVRANDHQFGTWPSGTSGNITTNLDAAMAAAWNDNRGAMLMLPAGNWTYTGTGYQGNATAAIAIAGPVRNMCTINLGPGVVLINTTQTVQRVIIDNLTAIGGWGFYRGMGRGAASSANAYRRVFGFQHKDFTGTSISSAPVDQAFWRVDARLQGLPAAPNTIGLAINGLMDGSKITVNSSNIDTPLKLGNGAQNSRISVTHTYSNESGRTRPGNSGWLVPEWNGHGVEDSRGPGHPGGVLDVCKLGTENLNPAIDRRFIAVDPQGVFPTVTGAGGLQVELAPNAEIPVGWTCDIETPGDGSFRVIGKKDGVTVETTSYFTTLQQAAAWAGPRLLLIDLSSGQNTTGIPAAETGVPIGDWSTAQPAYDRPSRAYLQGVTFRDTRISNAGNAVNPPMLTVSIPPANLIGCEIRGTYFVDSSGTAAPPNWPECMVKFIGSTTPPATLGMNLIGSTTANTRRPRPAEPTGPKIPVSNVAGVFAVADDSAPLHLGRPTAVPNTSGSGSPGVGATATISAGDDRAHVITWTTGASGVAVGRMVDVTFSRPYGAPPMVMVTTAANRNQSPYVTNVTATGYTLGLAAAPGTSQNNEHNVLVIPRPS